jgi:hypothetical protein
VSERLRHISWWRWLLMALTLAAVVYVAIAETLAAAIAAVIGIAAAVFAVWNPFAARPHPKLTLQPVGGAETTDLTVGSGLRRVDIDSVVEDARSTALASRPLGLLFTVMKYAKPTKEDHAKYEADVESYAQKVRSWAEEAEAWVRAHDPVLHAQVIQENPSSVDAEDAGVYIFFPPGTKGHPDPELPPEPPARPRFPLRKSPLAMAMDPFSGGYPLPRVSSVSLTPPDLVEAVSRWDADYDEMSDGRLRLSWRRQPVRHGESEPVGNAFMVRLPVGEHTVRWEVHARNLPWNVSGTWTVSYRPNYSGEPIDTLTALEAALGYASGAAEGDD